MERRSRVDQRTQPLQVVGSSVRFDNAAQVVNFDIEFNHKPDFFTLDASGRQLDSWQISLDTMPFTKLGDTAHCHLAASFRDPYPVDAEGHLWFRDTPIKGGLELNGGTACIGDAPGLGAELDLGKLEAMAG